MNDDQTLTKFTTLCHNLSWFNSGLS